MNKNSDFIIKRKCENESKKIVVVSAIILAIFLLIPVVSDYFNLLERLGMETSNWITYLSSLISTVGAVLGTYVYTKKSNDDTIKKEKELHDDTIKKEKELHDEKLKLDKEIHDEKLKLDKEIQYRAMNKQNFDVIISEIKKFYGNACYMNELINIEKMYDVTGLFSSEYRKLDTINKVFLKRIKDDFFYDKIINEKIGKFEALHCGSTDYFVECKQLFETFYGFSDEGNMCINFSKYNKNARLKFYENLMHAEDWGYNKLRQKVTFSLNNSALFTEFMSIQKDKQNLILDKCFAIYKILNCVPKTSRAFKTSMNDEHSTLYKELKDIYKETFPQKEECDLEIFYIYSAQFQHVSGIMPYNSYGIDNEEYTKCYLEAFKSISDEDIDMFNVSYQNIEKYNYI